MFLEVFLGYLGFLKVLGGSCFFFFRFLEVLRVSFVGSCGFCVFLGGSWRLLKVFEVS